MIFQRRFLLCSGNRNPRREWSPLIARISPKISIKLVSYLRQFAGELPHAGAVVGLRGRFGSDARDRNGSDLGKKSIEGWRRGGGRRSGCGGDRKEVLHLQLHLGRYAGAAVGPQERALRLADPETAPYNFFLLLLLLCLLPDLPQLSLHTHVSFSWASSLPHIYTNAPSKKRGEKTPIISSLSLIRYSIICFFMLLPAVRLMSSIFPPTASQVVSFFSSKDRCYSPGAK